MENNRLSSSEVAQDKAYWRSPLGVIKLTANDTGLCSLGFIDDNLDDGLEDKGAEDAEVQTRPEHEILAQAITQLTEYFSGQRKHFDLPLKPSGTEFQQRVWKALVTIEYGRTASYLDIALMINKPKAVRAVGAANGKNPIGIVVPCHRIIGSNGTLTGYAGGLERKKWLLDHEAGATPLDFSRSI